MKRTDIRIGEIVTPERERAAWLAYQYVHTFAGVPHVGVEGASFDTGKQYGPVRPRYFDPRSSYWTRDPLAQEGDAR